MEIEDVPIKIKYGFLTNVNIEISYLSLQLKLLEIEDFIIVVEPEASNASEVEKVLSKEETFQVLGHLLDNYKAMTKGKEMKENPYLENFEKQYIEDKRKFIFQEPQQQQGQKNDENNGESSQIQDPGKGMPTKENIREMNEKGKDEQSEQAPPNVMGSELYELIFGRLNFQIKINNVKIYYENDHSQKSEFGNKVEFQKSFSIMFNIKGLNLVSVIFLLNN